MRVHSLPVLSQIGKRGAASIAALVLAGTAWAGNPYFSGPSIVKVATPVLYTGRDFAPNAAVTVVISTAQDGAGASYGAVVGPDGTLTYEVRARTAGPHTLTVTDSGGRTLVSLHFTASN